MKNESCPWWHSRGRVCAMVFHLGGTRWSRSLRSRLAKKSSRKCRVWWALACDSATCGYQCGDWVYQQKTADCSQKVFIYWTMPGQSVKIYVSSINILYLCLPWYSYFALLLPRQYPVEICAYFYVGIAFGAEGGFNQISVTYSVFSSPGTVLSFLIYR